MKFSQRMGLTPPPRELQLHEMPSDLRNSLWNVVIEWDQWRTNESKIFNCIWKNFFKKPIDEISYRVNLMGVRDYSEAALYLRDSFLRWRAIEVYDFLDFLLTNLYDKKLEKAIDKVLEKELSPCRVVAKKIAPISNQVEKEEVETAIDSHKYPGLHIQKALILLSNRTNPDYENSSKEAICAVEAAAKLITNNKKATLGELLSCLENKFNLPSPLGETYKKLYGYISNTARHGVTQDSNIDQADARFFLISCSAFVNYLMSKYKPIVSE